MCIKIFKCYVNYNALWCNSIPDIIILFWNGILFNKHLETKDYLDCSSVGDAKHKGMHILSIKVSNYRCAFLSNPYSLYYGQMSCEFWADL